MFGGLIHCVRTFGDQLINGIKTFSNSIRFSSNVDEEKTIISSFVNEYQLFRINLKRTSSTSSIYYDCVSNGFSRISQYITNSKAYLYYSPSNAVIKNVPLEIESSSISESSLTCKGWVNKKLIDKAVLYPDYSTKTTNVVATSSTTTAEIEAYSFTALTNGFIQSYAYNQNAADLKMLINGNEVYQSFINGDPAYQKEVSQLFPVLEGDVVTFTTTHKLANLDLYFYSNKGV